MRNWLTIGLIILLILLAICLFVVRPDGLFMGASIAAGQGGDTLKPTDPGMVPVGCWLPNGTWLYWNECPVRVVTATPQATNTPTPAVTFEPTQEIPTITPTPAPTQPPLKVCRLRSITVINVRSGPGTNYGIRDKWQQGDEREFVKFDDSDRDYLWGYSDDGVGGWTAVYDKAASSWFVAGTQGAVLCVDVEGWPPGLVPPEPFAWQPPEINRGVHFLTGSNGSPVIQSLSEYGNVKGLSGNENLIKQLRAAYPDMLIVWRNWVRVDFGAGDGPRDWGQGDVIAARLSADQWWSIEYNTWDKLGLIGVVDFFEYRNELPFVGDWEIAFDLRILEHANAAGICLAMFSDGYGNPTLLQFNERAPVLDYMLEYECQPGRRHVIAAHSYSRYDSGPWLFDRWQLQRDFWRGLHGDKYDALQWLFTEFGLPNTVGAYDGRGVPDCALARADLVEIDRIFDARPEIIGYQIFGAGNLPPWYDWGQCR